MEDISLPGYDDQGYDYARRDSTPSIGEAVSVGNYSKGSVKVSKSLFKQIRGWLVTPLTNKKTKDIADTFDAEFLEENFDVRRPVVDG